MVTADIPHTTLQNIVISNACFMTDDQVIFVPGIGHIGQYYSYMDTFWGKGVAYFLRDTYLRELESLLGHGATRKKTEDLVERINLLNKRITEFEANRDLFLAEETERNAGLFKG